MICHCFRFTCVLALDCSHLRFVLLRVEHDSNSNVQKMSVHKRVSSSNARKCNAQSGCSPTPDCMFPPPQLLFNLPPLHSFISSRRLATHCMLSVHPALRTSDGMNCNECSKSSLEVPTARPTSRLPRSRPSTTVPESPTQTKL